MTLCTLFDSNYLDKGLALYYSLRKNTKNFVLYIFTFDEVAENVLNEIGLKNAVVIPYKNIETEQLKVLKKERTRAEFCWTCTPIVIEYVLDKYKEKSCTYIDADMYFFGDPNILYQEILKSGCSVGIAPHRFVKNEFYYTNVRNSGEFCVHFNTFFNDENGRTVLEEWKEKCLECCSAKVGDGKLGDQKYLEAWPKKYDYIHILEHAGGGVAPWNIDNFVDVMKRNGKIYMIDKNGDKSQLIFYHFEYMKYLPKHYIYLNMWDYRSTSQMAELKDLFDDLRIKRIKNIYCPYLKKIREIRIVLKRQYNVTFKHMTLKKKGASLFLPNLKNGISEWIYMRRNVMKNYYL